MTKTDDFLSSSEKFKLESADRNIGAWIRKFSDGSNQDWISAENSLMRILLDYALINPDSLEEPEGSSLEKIANTIARSLGNCGRTTEYSTDYLVTLAALSYGTAGNFPSAAVFANQAKKNNQKMGVAEKWMIEVLSSKKFILKDTNPPPDFISYCILMDQALLSGQETDFEQARQALDRACKASLDNIDRTDKFLLLFWKQIHKRFEQLSATRVLREIGFQNQAFIEALREETLMLYPSQVHTLKKFPLTQPGNPVFISLPTSTGKSLLGEIALVSSLMWDKNRWLAVYLAPYRALTDQLQARMKKRLRKIGISCVIRRGGYLSDETALDDGKRTILVATPEAFDSLLRTKPEYYKKISACVFDEFHLVEQQQRGLRYEGLLARFLSGAAGVTPPKIVALSAVIQDTESIKEWLKISDDNISKLPWIPTSRRLAIVSPSGQAQYFCPGENIRDDKDGEIIWKGQIQLKHKVNRYPITPPERQNIVENIAAISVDQWKRFEKPVLVLASIRNQTRLIARAISTMLEPQTDTTAYALAQEISSRYPYLYTLQNSLKYKVAYHNASLPDWVRSQLEKLIQNRELNLVAATTTLAEGVDLPFRSVVLAGWKHWLFGKSQPMPSLLFRNISGRCGRAWEYVEGDTLIVDSPDKEIETFTERNRFYVDNYIKPKSYRLRSSLEIDSLANQPISSESQSTLESQYIAYIDACDKVEGIEARFSESLFASTSDEIKTLTFSIINEFTNKMLFEEKFPVLQRNSPLHLTDFGKIALATGLSPRSGVLLAGFVTTYSEIPVSKAHLTRLSKKKIYWEAIPVSLWQRCRQIQEIEHHQIGQWGFPVKEENFINLLLAWISGVPIEIIAYDTLLSSNKKTVKPWFDVQTETIPSNFEEDIDQVAVFCKQYLSERWSWVLRGAAIISQNINEPLIQSNQLSNLAKRFQHGVRHIATATLLEYGNCPVDRAKLDWLISSFLEVNTSVEIIDTKAFKEWISKGADSIPQIPIIPGFPKIKVTETDISLVLDFLEKNIREVIEE